MNIRDTIAIVVLGLACAVAGVQGHGNNPPGSNPVFLDQDDLALLDWIDSLLPGLAPDIMWAGDMSPADQCRRGCRRNLWPRPGVLGLHLRELCSFACDTGSGCQPAPPCGQPGSVDPAPPQDAE